MTREYTPRRASRRWLQDAPAYVLDCIDTGGNGDRYTVVFDKTMSSQTGSYAETWISYLGMSGAPTHPQGISIWGEMPAYAMAAYREANRRRYRVRWLDLPENIRNHVRARAEHD